MAMTDAVRWLFHHPRRLYTAAAVAIVAVLGLALAFAGGSSAREATVNTSTAATASSSSGSLVPSSPAPRPPVAPLAGPVDPGSAPASSADATKIALAFTAAWAAHPAGQSQQQWLAALTPYVTGRLRDLFAYTDAGAQPSLRITGPPTIRYSAATSAQLSIPLSNSSRVAVTVIRENVSWKIFDIEPDAGDGAAAPSP